MKKLLIIVVCIFLSSCATERRYQELLNKTLGISEDELIVYMGVPDRTYNTGTLRVLEYNYNQTSYVPMIQEQTVYHKNSYGYNIGSSSQWVDNGFYANYNCVTIFYIKNNRVINWRYKGNACKA